MAKISMVKIDCPLCGSEKNKRLFSFGNKLFPVNISICQNCGFVFHNPRFSEQGWDNYYRVSYDLYHRPISSDHACREPIEISPAAVGIIDRLKKQNLDTAENILEVGAGSGEILDSFKTVTNSRKILLAIEPSAKCKKILNDKGIKIIGNSFDDFSEEFSGKIDLLIMRHTLEHLYYPFSAIKKISRLMRKDGVIYISVPDLYASSDFPFCFPHISYFTQATFGMLGRKAGLIVREIERVNGEICGIFVNSDELTNRVSEDRSNYELTLSFIRKQYKLPLQKKIKSVISWFVPNTLLEKYLLIGHRGYF